MSKLIKIIKQNSVLIALFLIYFIIFLWQKPITIFFASAEIQTLIGSAIYEGWLGLVDYLSAHVLLCLIPAFFIAGAVNSLLDTQQILKYLSGQTKKWLAYLIASLGGFFIQVCSCTILPLFAGIWKRGAGLGIAVTFLYAGPAVNIVSLILTGQRLGWGLSITRMLLSIVFSIIVGLVMEFVFRKEAVGEAGKLTILEETSAFKSSPRGKIFWGALFAILIIGTAPIGGQLKYILVGLLALFTAVFSFIWIRKESRKKWWRETNKFIREIIPTLLIGVFLASAITSLIPEAQFRNLTSSNNLLTNFVAVLFGAIAYFPALVEVPIAENFMRLGMNKGPLMAYLLSDPVLSLQGLLIIHKLIGTKKTFVYTTTIVVLTTLAGLIYGAV